MFTTENLNINALIIFSSSNLINTYLSLLFFREERAKVRFFSQVLI